MWCCVHQKRQVSVCRCAAQFHQFTAAATAACLYIQFIQKFQTIIDNRLFAYTLKHQPATLCSLYTRIHKQTVRYSSSSKAEQASKQTYIRQMSESNFLN